MAYFRSLSGITTCIATFVVLLLPFSGSYQAMLQSVITFHSTAAQVYSYSQQANFSIIQNALTSLLTLTALFGTVAALLRRDWRVVPLNCLVFRDTLLALAPGSSLPASPDRSYSSTYCTGSDGYWKPTLAEQRNFQ